MPQASRTRLNIHIRSHFLVLWSKNHEGLTLNYGRPNSDLGYRVGFMIGSAGLGQSDDSNPNWRGLARLELPIGLSVGFFKFWWVRLSVGKPDKPNPTNYMFYLIFCFLFLPSLLVFLNVIKPPPPLTFCSFSPAGSRTRHICISHSLTTTHRLTPLIFLSWRPFLLPSLSHFHRQPPLFLFFKKKFQQNYS
jgi:hypothetical protein